MGLLPAETASFPSPIPTQFVASDEFTPAPQTERQKQVEARIKELGTRLAKYQGVSRRRFFQTAAGMAAAHRLGDRPRGNSREVRREERLRRPRPDLRPEHGGGAAPVRGHDGHARQGPRRRPRGVGHRCDLDRRAAWQIEAMRRLEIPEDMQKQYGFPALGPADGSTKRAIFGENSARLYKYDAKRRAELTTDRIALARADYEREGPGRTNRRYGFVLNPSA